jgi:hypothetical protein
MKPINNLFTSLPLLNDLHKRNSYATRTILDNRICNDCNTMNGDVLKGKPR